MLGGEHAAFPFASVLAAITLVVGVGLLLRVEFICGFVNVTCFLQILGNLLGIVLLFIRGIASLDAVAGLIVMLVQIHLGMLMVYLIGETETRGPGF